MAKKQNAFMRWYESYQGKKIVGMVYSLGASVVIIGALFKIMHFPGAGPMLMVGMGVEALLFAIGCLDKPHAEFQWHNVFPQLVGEEGTEPEFYKYVQTLPKPNLAAVTGNVGGAAAGAGVPGVSDKDMEALKGGINELAKTATQLSELGKVAVSTNKLGEKLEVATEAADKFVAAQSTLANASQNLGAAYTTVANDMQNVVAGTKQYGQNVEAAGKQLAALNSLYELQVNAVQAQVEAYKAQVTQVNSLSQDVQKLQAASQEAVKNAESYSQATKQLAAQVADLNKVYGNMLNALA